MFRFVTFNESFPATYLGNILGGYFESFKTIPFENTSVYQAPILPYSANISTVLPHAQYVVSYESSEHPSGRKNIHIVCI